MSRFRIVLAVFASILIPTAVIVCCPANKQFIASDLIEPVNVYATSGGCDHCPVPSVVLVPFNRAQSAGKGIDSNLIGFASAAFIAGVGESDPKSSCLTISEDTAAVPYDDDNIPKEIGPDPIEGGDYAIVGKVFGAANGSGYTLLVAMQDATTRESVVRNISVDFTDPYKITDVARSAAAQFAPIIDKIRDFQKKKRDESNDTAIKAEIKVTPSKQKMNFGEQQSVEVFAHDCDGDDHPLKNRKLTLKSDNGTFSPAEVTTGPDGKAKTTFTAQKKGLGKLVSTYAYTDVTHKQKTAEGDASLQIGDPPSGVWEVDIDVEETIHDDTHQKKSDGATVNDTHEIKRTGHATVWIKATSDDGQVNSSEVVAISAWADFTDDSRVLHQKTGCNGQYRGTIVNEGVYNADGTVFAFTVDDNHANITGTISLLGSGFDASWDHDKCRTPANVHQQQLLKDASSAIELGYGSDQLDAPQNAQTRQTKTFTFKLDKHEKEVDADKGTSYTKERTGTITLHPLTASQTPAGLRRH